MTAVVKLAHQRGIWVISDECYVYLNYTGSAFRWFTARVPRPLHGCWVAFEDIRMTGGVWDSRSAPRRSSRGAEAAEPVHVESNVDRAESAVAALKGSQQCVKTCARTTSSCAIT